MEIVERNIDTLREYERNAKIHSEVQIANLTESIQRFGFRQPIVIDKNGVIVAGHGRLAAARAAGLRSVPCVMADDLSEDDIKAYRVLDNKLAESPWNESLLAAELPELDLAGFDLDFPELPALPETGGKVIEDEVPEVNEGAEPICQLGDIWQLGRHRLMCGDSTDPEAFKALMGGELADMVFTDPPYGVSIGDKNKTLNSVQRAGRCINNIANDTLSEEKLYLLLKSAFCNVRNNCKEDASYYVTSPQGGSLGLMMMMMKDAGLPVRHVLMWRKNSATFSLGRLDYDYQHEPIFYTWTKSHHNYRTGKCRTTVWDFDKPRKCDLHPTMKPVELIATAIIDFTKEGDIVLDAFGGSGSTLIACEQLNRQCRMMELDPHYCDVIIERWEKFTGQKAVRL